MKKLIVIMFLLCAAVPMYARGNGFNIGLGSQIAIEGDKNFPLDDCGKPYRWGMSVIGGYTLNFGRFFFNPEVALYWEKIKQGYDAPYYVHGWSFSDGNNFGGSVAAHIGYNIGAGFEVFTGPWTKCNFAQWHSKDGEWNRQYNRAEALWRIGVGYTLWRMTLRASYNIQMSDGDYWATAKCNTIDVAIYYNF